MDVDHFVLTGLTPLWRRTAWGNDQNSVARYSMPGAAIPEVILVTGYNIASGDGYLVDLAREFSTVPIIFNSQVGVRPPGSEDRDGPGWRIVVTDGDSMSAHDVPFDALAQSGITLY